MSDSFRLGQVLDHARLKEEARAIELSALDAEYHRAAAALEQLRDQEAAQLRALAETSRRGGAFDPAAIEAARHYLAHLEASIEKQLAEVAAMEARVEASRMELLAVSREKRLLEQLEQRHDESTAMSTARRESARSDELSGQRHQRQQQRPHGEVA
jgi:flagellar export protein FliJ